MVLRYSSAAEVAEFEIEFGPPTTKRSPVSVPMDVIAGKLTDLLRPAHPEDEGSFSGSFTCGLRATPTTSPRSCHVLSAPFMPSHALSCPLAHQPLVLLSSPAVRRQPPCAEGSGATAMGSESCGRMQNRSQLGACGSSAAGGSEGARGTCHTEQHPRIPNA